MQIRNVSLASLALTLCLTPEVYASEEPMPNVVVTGTRIQQAAPAGIFVLDRKSIDETGANTLAELVRDLVHTSSGTVDENFTQGFSPASAGINLRGLGVNRTLVLLNGRRMPVFPFGQEGSESFVDINLIPLAAIERIEVLKDGASAIYGSDAIAGVVNIITRDAAGGNQASAEFTSTSESDGETTRLSLSTGAIWGKAELSFGLDYMDRKPIMSRDRGTRTANGPVDDRSSAGNPGTFITSRGPVPDAACPADRLRGPFCTYDFASDTTLVPGTERIGVYGGWDQDLTDTTGVYANLMYSTSTSERDLAGAPNAYPVADANPNNPFGEDVLAIYRLLELGPRRDQFETDAYNFHTGINGYAGDWRWELAGGISNVETNIKGVNGYATAADVQSSIDSGVLNVFGPSPDFDPASVAFQSLRSGESTLETVSFALNGDLAETRNGPIQAAFGVEFRNEDFHDKLDPISSSGAVVGVGGTSADGGRQVGSAYAETAIPLGEALGLTLAYRYDDYDDFGSSHSPKVGIEWHATDNLILHASFGSGFKAPALHELYAGEIFAFESVFDTTNCQAAQAANDAAGIAAYCATVTEVMSIASGNRTLTAEESKQFVAGLKWKSERHLTLGLDYWTLQNDNAVISSPQFFIDNEAQNAANVMRDPGGNIATILSPFANVAAQELWGVDLDVTTGYSLDALGDITLSLTASYLGAFEQQPSPGEPTEDLAGRDGHVDWRIRGGLGWARGTTSAMFGINFVDAYERQVASDPVSSWTTLDLHASWTPTSLRGGSFSLNVDNLLNDEPPKDPFLGGWPFFNRALHDARGRSFTLGYSHAF